jgi:hypothetical protein
MSEPTLQQKAQEIVDAVWEAGMLWGSDYPSTTEETDAARSIKTQAPARIQALVDGAREEGRKAAKRKRPTHRRSKELDQG